MTAHEEPAGGWQILAERLIYEHRPWLRLIEQDVRLPNGHTIEKYLLSDLPEVAMIFGVTAGGDVIFVEQYKHGIGAMSLDLCAGYIDGEDESIRSAAARELREESGYVSEDWTQIGSFAIDPNRSSAQIHYFLARDCRLAGEQQLDPSEDLVVQLIPLHQTEQLAASGRIVTVTTAAGIALAIQLLRLMDGATNTL